MIDEVDFTKGDGLVPAIVQHADTGSVLMLGYMNAEALRETLARRRVVFFSRSRQALWEKGETSGNTLDFVSFRVDCDRDTLLITARPRGPVCHTGSLTCFGNEPATFLGQLEAVIVQRISSQPDGSYTARLFAQGPKRIAQKVGEEGLEVALAAAAEGDDKVVAESADLMFHLLVLLRSRGIAFEQVISELAARHASAAATK
jgi:phosphoribosyl-AMP cyclohydrolase / phosphoribosyl-ATP pyrophosphohydrolase